MHQNPDQVNDQGMKCLLTLSDLAFYADVLATRKAAQPAAFLEEHFGTGVVRSRACRQRHVESPSQPHVMI
jgi:hypothetical protein